MRPTLLIASLAAVWAVVPAVAADHPAAAPVPGHPRQTTAEATKRAVLLLAEERAKLGEKAGIPVESERSDLSAAQALDAAVMARQVSDAAHVSALLPVAVTVGNPYLDGLVAKAKGMLAKPDGTWPRATAEAWTFKELGGASGVRTNAVLMRELLWLYANPASPLHGDAELLTRLLRRAHAFVDLYNLGTAPGFAPAPPAGRDAADPYDQFTLEAAFQTLREFRDLYPGLLLPGQQAAWDRCFHEAGNKVWAMMKGANAWNLNIETARMVAVLNIGYATANQEMVDRVQAHVDKVLARMRPDGAWPYNGESNPSVNYHDELLASLVRLLDQTGYQPIREALAASQWKGPVMGRTDEFWTSPFHKTYRWNFTRGTEAGPEAVAALSRNGYVRTLLDRDEHTGVDNIAWYRKDIPAKPLPDRYTIPDRNVGGPRAWYGNFCYAGTFRAPPPKEAGHETLMGAMTVDDDGRLNSILTDVTPRVRATLEPLKDAKGREVSQAWGRLTADMTGVFLTGRNVSASAATHGIATVRLGAYLGNRTGWKARQLWLGLPDRVIGVVSTVPDGEAPKAYDVTGVLRLISGGSSGAATCKKLETLAPDHFRYGQLDIVVHASTYRSLTPVVMPYRNEKLPATELTFQTRADPTVAPSVETTHPADADYAFAVEIRPSWTTSSASVEVDLHAPLLSLAVTSGGKRYHLWYNSGSEAAAVTVEAGGSTSLHLSGESAPTVPAPASTTLQPGQEALLIGSSDPQDHLPGWGSFAEMVSAR